MAPSPRGKAPSMADVARLAGVSVQTVSRVSNGLDNVQASTRATVESSMKELNYRPNRAARALRSGSFRSIGVIVFTFHSFGNMRTIEAIATAAAEQNYSIVLIPATTRTQKDVSRALASLEEQHVDGVILLMESHLIDETEIRLDHLPVVLVDSALRREDFLVDADQAQGARQATEHLLQLGHDTVWHISGPDGSFSAERREAAWRQTLQENGRGVPKVFRGDWTTDVGYQLGQQIARRAEITAVFVSNDQMALGLLRACHEIGRVVPETLSVVGFDDMPESGSFWPPLTTVHQDFAQVGRRSVQYLLAALSGDHTVHEVKVPTRLVVRASTAVPRASTAAPRASTAAPRASTAERDASAPPRRRVKSGRLPPSRDV